MYICTALTHTHMHPQPHTVHTHTHMIPCMHAQTYFLCTPSVSISFLNPKLRSRKSPPNHPPSALWEKSEWGGGEKEAYKTKAVMTPPPAPLGGAGDLGGGRAGFLPVITTDLGEAVATRRIPPPPPPRRDKSPSPPPYNAEQHQLSIKVQPETQRGIHSHMSR